MSWLVITIFIVAVPAHWPDVGVNVYIVVPIEDVLITEGLQVPLIPSVDIDGSEGAVLFLHKGPGCEKVGLS